MKWLFQLSIFGALGRTQWGICLKAVGAFLVNLLMAFAESRI